MNCQILFSGKDKKNIINVLSAELAQRVVKVTVLGGMGNSVDTDQTAPEGVCLSHFVRNFGVQNFRSCTVY